MAVTPQSRLPQVTGGQVSAFEVVDLRAVSGRALAPLFEEEERHWHEQLQWDYRPSVEMIRKHVEAHSLPGYAALRRGAVVGYCFFVYEDEKGLLGDLYVLDSYRRERPYGDEAGIATLLLRHALETLERSPPVRRIEAQLIPFGIEPLEPLFRAHGFDSFPRLFMYKPLTPKRWPHRSPGGAAERAGGEQAASEPAPGPGVELRPWDDNYFEAMADLIVDSYSRHVDSRINDHYGSSAGALRFLKNIVIFPGCGIFQRDASLVALLPKSRAGEELVGAVLASQVARGVSHITQICVRRRWQGRGVGRRLLVAALDRLVAKGYSGVSLTVTAENAAAVTLYRQLDFAVTKEFAAFARDLR
jgi:ribosomal protein S18 acetylase RimI-like enzyme